jgi:hypothetical protein
MTTTETIVWNPVSEGMPENNRYVMVYYPGHVLHCYHDKEGWRGKPGFHLLTDCRFTHWAELPQGPQEADDE